MANQSRKAKQQQAQEKSRKKILERARKRAKGRRSGVFALPGMVPPLPESAHEPSDGDLENCHDDDGLSPDARQEVEALFRQMMEVLANDVEPRDAALEQARDLVEEAIESRGPERVDLARQALEVYPDCADAYVLLAENAPTPQAAVSLYREGVAAGARQIGKRAFKQLKGHFWLATETRPYMRAREGLARTLWELGEHDEALSHYRDMLALNPNDNQGVRYLLASALVERERDNELAALLREYENDGSADWAYTRALLAFRKGGDSPEARGLLETAWQTNRHVPAYLLGERRVPRRLPEYISPGEPSEAISCAVGLAPGWRDTPGALTWLRQTLPAHAAPARSPRRRKGPDVAEGVAELPLTEDIWQMDIRRIPMEFPRTDRGDPPHAVWILDSASGQIVSMQTSVSRPSPSAAWRHLVEGMLRPKMGSPRRPSIVQVRLSSLFDEIANRLDELDVECQLLDDLEAIDALAMAGAEMLGATTGSEIGLTEEVSESDLARLLPVADEVWQADARLLAAWIGGEGAPQRPWCILVSNRNEGLVLRHELMMQPPEPALLWSHLAMAMARPIVGQPHRPGVVEVCSPEQHALLRPRLERIGVRCVVRDDLDHLDFLYRDLASHLDAPNKMTALVDVPGVKPEQVGALFEAAAAFYRKRPWRDVPGDTPVRIECEGLETRVWHAVLMGQMGVTQGVALHDDAAVLARMLRGNLSDRENLRLSSGLSLLYNEAFQIAPADLATAEKFGWPVAGPEAYPWAVRLSPGGAVRSPLAWEIELLTAALLALPEFLKQGGDPLETTVPTAKGRLTLRVSWPAEGAFP